MRVCTKCSSKLHQCLTRFAHRLWYRKSPAAWLLLPLSLLFGLISHIRRRLFQLNILRSYKCPVPVIVVGNITVGGTGKTPVVIGLAEQLTQQGLRVGIVSRGYGGSKTHEPMFVDAKTNPSLCGDEPALIASKTKLPVVVCAKRKLAVQALISQARLDAIICDDGLQHYALARDVELVCIDAARQFGNGLLLPAGPLREPVARLRTVDATIAMGAAKLADTSKHHFNLRLEPVCFYHLQTGERVTLDYFKHKKVHAVAGIANPNKFFQELRGLGCQIVEHAYPDHFAYRTGDLAFNDDAPIILTEKDAVKCAEIATEHTWVLQVQVSELDKLAQFVLNKLKL